MDRFIEWLSCSFILCSVSLKSNMDRFIVTQVEFIHILICYLKSNMDRFIVRHTFATNFIFKFKIQYGQIYRNNANKCTIKYKDLKSNMDRFIVSDIIKIESQYLRFKIQYGQIYRQINIPLIRCKGIFKIQYGQIYRAKMS